MTPPAGAESPRGPGWWLASDGKYYPPELATGARGSSSGTPKKKVVKKKAAPPAAAGSSGGAASAAGTGSGAPKKKVVKKKATPPGASTTPASASGAPKKKVVKKKAAPPAAAAKPANPAPKAAPAAKAAPEKATPTPATAKPAAASNRPADPPDDDALDAQRGGALKYTAKPPPTDQIAARRIQAKEQLSLLAGARAEAALRAMAVMTEEDEPVLVGVGTRSLDARSDRRSAINPPSAPSPPSAQPAAKAEPITAKAAPPATVAEPKVAEPKVVETVGAPATAERAASPPVALDRGLPDIPPVTPREPARAPAVGTPYQPSDRQAPAARVEPAAPPSAPAATPATPAPATPAPAPAPAADAPTPTTASPSPVPTSLTPPPATPPVIARPHQPLKGPAPSAAPMGTDVPFMEVKGSALGTDIDRIGEKIMIFADRVELRDRNNTARQSIRYDELAEVEVQKKIMGPSLVITSVTGTTLTAKALRPELASGAKAMIEKHAERFMRGEGAGARSAAPPADTSPPTAALAEATPAVSPTSSGSAPASDVTFADPSEPAPAPAAGEAPASVDEDSSAPTIPVAGTSTHRFVLIAMLEELHDAGILSAEELETKKALIDLADRS